MNAITSPARLFRRNGSSENNTIWALKDVSFEEVKSSALLDETALEELHC